MKTIWKYPFMIADHIELKVPKGARFLCADEQRAAPTMWFEVDPGEPLETAFFELRDTGQPFDGTEGRYLTTLMIAGGALVFHLYTRRPS